MFTISYALSLWFFSFCGAFPPVTASQVPRLGVPRCEMPGQISPDPHVPPPKGAR